MAVVLDVNEMHPFQYDIYESGELPLIKGVPETGNREIIKTENSFHDMDEKSQEYIQFKIMRKFYGRNGKLDMAKCRFFYRPAVSLDNIQRRESQHEIRLSGRICRGERTRVGPQIQSRKQFLIYLIYRKEEMHGYKFC